MGGRTIDIKFYDELAEPSDFSKELLEEMLATGYAVEQLVDGVTYIRMTSLYYEDLGDYIMKHPKELCRDYWNRVVTETRQYDIMSFMKYFCNAHATIKKLTKSEVDFCEMIGEEL
jgi:hypothetical protein